MSYAETIETELESFTRKKKQINEYLLDYYVINVGFYRLYMLSEFCS